METISTDKAPAAIGPYVQAVASGGFVFCSGQIAIDPATGKLAGGDMQSQALQVISNLRAVLGARGLELDHVVKMTVFVTDLGQFSVVNDVCAAAFGPHRPARAAVEVSNLPMGALIEIECIARLK